MEATYDEAHLVDGFFDSERMLAMLNQAVETALNDGTIGRMKALFRLVGTAVMRCSPPRHSLRIVDESGEDYIYLSDLFVAVKLPPAVARRLRRPAGKARRAARRAV